MKPHAIGSSSHQLKILTLVKFTFEIFNPQNEESIKNLILTTNITSKLI